MPVLSKLKTPPFDVPPAHPPIRSQVSKLWICAGFGAMFLFRLAFGLFSNMDFEDQRQIYLIGLKYYCTGLWPFFGPDVQTNVQIPGALQGLTAGLPFTLLPIPESPFILVNILSFAALCLFGWYVSRRLPAFPRWLLWGWLFTAPWLLNVSTNVYNLSYALFGSVLFFVGFLETVPSFSLGLLPLNLCNAMMGFSFLWIAQFHMSYIILAPFMVVSIYFQVRSNCVNPLRILLFISLGAIPPGAFLLPTFFQYGFHHIRQESQAVLTFRLSNLKLFPLILARYLAMASETIPRFWGRNNAERGEFLANLPWTIPFTFIALVLGTLQPILMFLLGFRKHHPQKDWTSVRALAFLTWILIGISFLFTTKYPSTRGYYLTLPIIFLYAFYVFQPLSSRPWFLRTAKLLLVCNLVFHIGVAVHNYRNDSFFSFRNSVVKAIRAKDFHLMAERRENSHY